MRELQDGFIKIQTRQTHRQHIDEGGGRIRSVRLSCRYRPGPALVAEQGPKQAGPETVMYVNCPTLFI